MNQVMWKYQLLVGMPTKLEVPEGAVVELVLAPTPDTVVFWARVDDSPLVPKVERDYRITGTGQSVGPGWDYCGSAAAPLGLMWHLWSRDAR